MLDLYQSSGFRMRAAMGCPYQFRGLHPLSLSTEEVPVQTFPLQRFVFFRGQSLYSLPPLEDLSRAEQAIYYLLGDFVGRSTGDFPSLSQEEIAALVQMLSLEGLCGYALFLIGKTNKMYPDELVFPLRRMAATEYLSWEESSTVRRLVLAIVAKYGKKVVLIKGAAAATLYPSPHFRHSADLDIVVALDTLAPIFAELESSGFSIKKEDCSLYRCGPLSTAVDLLLQPNSEFISCDALTLSSQTCMATNGVASVPASEPPKDGSSIGSYVDVKLDPLELGLHMLEIERFFRQCTKAPLNEFEICTADVVDQILISCCHLHKDNFASLRLLLDLHLLCKALPSEEWEELVRRSRVEAIEPTVWAALSLAVERLRTPVPTHVLERIGTHGKFFARQFFYLLNYRFLWNQNALPMLVLNALFSSNGQRKFRVLGRSFFPSAEFLSAYYAEKKPGDRYPLLLWLFHVFCICAPAGLVRRTLGRFLWV